MAIATVYTFDTNGLVAHELETGLILQAQVGGYGIIVIEDTMAPVQEKPLGTYRDDDLAIVLNPTTLNTLAATQLDNLANASNFQPILILRPVQVPKVGVRIAVSIPI